LSGRFRSKVQEIILFDVTIAIKILRIVVNLLQNSHFFCLLRCSLVEKKVFAFKKIYVRIIVKPLNYFN